MLGKIVSRIEKYIIKRHKNTFRKKALPVGTVCNLLEHNLSESISSSLICVIAGYVCDEDKFIPTLVIVTGKGLKETVPYGISGSDMTLPVGTVVNEHLEEIEANIFDKDHIYYFVDIKRLLNGQLVKLQKQELKINLKFPKNDKGTEKNILS